MRRSAMVWGAVSGLVLTAASGLAQTVFVNGSLTTGADNGTSWADAYRGRDAVARALVAAPTGSEIWVASGTYVATLTGSRSASHVLRGGVAVYGGFAGTESALSERNFNTNVTVLSGDLAGDDTAFPSTIGWAENTYNVVRAVGAAVVNTAVLDGFVIRQGFGNGGSATFEDRGGGLAVFQGATPTIRNCRFVNNRVIFGGGAVYINGASPSFADVDFDDNAGASFGGAIDAAFTGTPSFVRCRFRGNTAGRAGALELFSNMNATISNCVFQNNTATGTASGGALYLAGSTVTIRQSTIGYNRATNSVEASGIRVASGSVTLQNTIAWGNRGFNNATQQISGPVLASYTNIELFTPTATNFSVDPQFVSTGATGDLRLQLTSPMIDAGSSTLADAAVLVDSAGAARRVDVASVVDTGVGPAPIIDVGAFEAQNPVCYANCDGSSPVALSPADFSCFLAKYRAGDAYANCDGSSPVVLSPADFSCFLAAYRAGCP